MKEKKQKLTEKKQKLTASQEDGVQYRRAKLWQIILYSCNALVGMSVYTLIGLASYTASIGYGIATVAIGIILTCTRVFDGITDPLLAFLYDKVNTKWGKLRILIVGGFLVEAIALILMFSLVPKAGLSGAAGIVVFVLLYIVYVIGYTITNMTAQTIPAIMSNDPKQRPTIGVWTTAFNYVVPMMLSLILTTILLPAFGTPGQIVDGAQQFDYNQTYLSVACYVCVGIGALGTALVCVGISAFDKPENFVGTTVKKEKLSFKDMWKVLKGNRPLQCYIASAASDKIAQQTATQEVIKTLLFGIIIGNMGLSMILTIIAMFPSIAFAVVGAKYAGKYGSKKTIIDWSWISLAIAVVIFIFFVIIDPTKIAKFGFIMVFYVLLNVAWNGAKMCVTTANTSFMADIIDYELDRTGKYIPAAVSGIYSFVDKIVSSFSALIATGACALIGYVNTLPQPTDTCTPAIFWLTMAVYFGLPIIGWVVTLISMRACKLGRKEMVEVQKRIADKKLALAGNDGQSVAGTAEEVLVENTEQIIEENTEQENQ